MILPASGERPLPPIGGLVTSVRPGEYQSDGLVASVAFPPDRAAHLPRSPSPRTGSRC